MQNKINLVHFFDNDYVDQASYDNLRKIASCIDGLKNASRKVIYTILDKKIYEPTKVSQLSAKAAEYADYLHGSLDGVVVTLAQDFLGSNQLPLLKKKGNFGTRAIQEPSAPRYIFASGADRLKSLFNELDKPNLIKQTFEGANIEPMFYVPDLPVLLINGNKGVSSGFAQNILPRPLKEIEKIIKDFCKQQSADDLNKINKVKPFVGDFNGSVERDLEDPEKFKWLFTVNFEIDEKKSQIKLMDMPYGENLRGYLQTLDKLEDEKKIKSYEDCSNGDNFEFLIKFQKGSMPKSKAGIIKLLKLQTSVTENFTCIDEENKILEAQNPAEILGRYVRTKLHFLRLRKELMLQNLESRIGKLQSQMRFIEAVIAGELDFKKTDSAKLTEWFSKQKLFVSEGDSHSGFGYLHRLPMGKMSSDEVNKLQAEIYASKAELEEVQAKSIFELWV